MHSLKLLSDISFYLSKYINRSIKNSGLKRNRLADGYTGTTLIEMKAIAEKRKPGTGEVDQMKDYNKIIPKIPWIKKNTGDKVYFDKIEYRCNNEEIANKWKDDLEKNLSGKFSIKVG